MRSPTENKLAAAFRRAFGRPGWNPTHASRDTEEEWDSLKHVELMFAVEDAFHCRFTQAQLEQMDSFAAILKAIDPTHQPANETLANA